MQIYLKHKYLFKLTLKKMPKAKKTQPEVGWVLALLLYRKDTKRRVA